MDIEQLNKSQIVLLTLLVSFVTSIATGIVTVSLMQQAPPAITQTVNRVVERTVEKVVPGQEATVAAPITKTETVIIKESDTIARAVTAVTPSIVRAYSMSAEAPVFLSLGAVVSGTGIVAVDASALGERPEAMIEVGSGIRVRGSVIARSAESGLAFLSTATTTEDGKPVPAWKPLARATKIPVLGETVVALSGKTALRVAQGILASTESAGAENPFQLLETDIAESAAMPGMILINTDGGAIGVSTGISRTQGSGVFISGESLAPPKASPAP